MPANEPKKLPGIFISYRRSDNPDAVGRIYDRLVSEFGKARVFKDVDSIPLGQDFRGHLNAVVSDCAAVLAIVGPKWADVRNEAGQRRLEDPDDFVRIELEAACARNIPVVPVLVGHATLPGIGQLPPSLASLTYRQSIEIRPDPDFHNDATRLVGALRRILDPNAPDMVVTPNRPQPWLVALAITALAAAAVLAVPAWRYLRQDPPAEARVDIVTPATDRPLDFALAPDGKQIVFVAKGDGEPRLWLRLLAVSTAQPLPGTEGAIGPFWSPDSRSIAFFAAGELKRLDLDGGQPQTLAVVRKGGAGTGTWSKDGVILFVDGQLNPLMRVADTGGAATEIIKASADGWPNEPVFLPGDRQFLYVLRDGMATGIYLGALDGKAPVRVTTDVSPVAYLPSGWMLWIRSGTLLAQELDLETATLTGKPQSIADGVDTMSVATSGLVSFRADVTRPRQLQWMNRSGAVQGTIGEPDSTQLSPRVSPDGRRVAVVRLAQGDAIIWLLEGTRTSRVTFQGEANHFPVWSPDGGSLAFSSLRGGLPDIYQKPSNGEGTEELLLKSGGPSFSSSWIADGRYLLYTAYDPETNFDLWILPMTGDRKPFAFLEAPSEQHWGRFSPDGRWVAYMSVETTRSEIYVRPFRPESGAAAGQWQLSTAGGVDPVWSTDGKELYYINPARELMAVPITVTGNTLAPGVPRRLFQTRIVTGPGWQYDVAPDGRFLINTELDPGPTSPITLIQNWYPDASK